MLVAAGTRVYQPAYTRRRKPADGAFLQAFTSPQTDFMIYSAACMGLPLCRNQPTHRVRLLHISAADTSPWWTA